MLKTHFVLALTALLVLVGANRSAAEPNLAGEWNSPAIAWKDLKSGIPEATETKKTVMMVFHASWCTACKQYRSVFKDQGVIDASSDLIMILVDVDQDKMANGAFSPDGTYVPRTLFMTPDGDVRTDLTGKSDPEHPHTIDIEKPDELRALMQRATEKTGPDRSTPSDQRAEN